MKGKKQVKQNQKLGNSMNLGVDQISPDEWGASVDYDSWKDQSHRVTIIFLHWPGTPQKFKGNKKESIDALKSYESYHMNTLKWRGLAYDYAIDLTGNLFRIRGLAISGATGGDINENGIPNNIESDAILLLIGPGQSLSEAMIKTLVTVLKSHKNARNLYGHQESAQQGTGTRTSCPGPSVMNFIRAWRKGSIDKGEELAHLDDNAQKWLQSFYEEGKKRDVKPSSVWNVLDLYRHLRDFFERGF